MNDADLTRRILESLIFVSEQPVSAQALARIARVDLAEVRRVLELLAAEHRDRGIVLEEIAGGWQFRTHPELATYVREYLQARPARLSRAALETLAIVAYRQPLTRPEIEDVRGVDSGGVLKLLLERGLIKILGKKEEPGRPLLYGTTPVFLEFFHLKSLRDLPTLREFTELSDESQSTLERALNPPTEERDHGEDPKEEGGAEAGGRGEVAFDAAPEADDLPGSDPRSE